MTKEELRVFLKDCEGNVTRIQLNNGEFINCSIDKVLSQDKVRIVVAQGLAANMKLEDKNSDFYRVYNIDDIKDIGY